MTEPADSPAEDEKPKPKRRRSPKKKAEPKLTLQDVVDKAVARTADLMPPAPERGNGHAVQAEDAEEIPSVEEIAREHHEAELRGAIPPAETDPEKSDGPRTEPFQVSVEYDPDQKIRSFQDLMSSLADEMASGQFYVEVERTAPSRYGGADCKGVMQPIRQSLTYEDFVSLYGGGTYRLRLHGPPKRGGRIDPRTNRMKTIALTSWIKHYLNPDANAPKFDLLRFEDDDSEYETEDDDMQTFKPGFAPLKRPLSSGDARAHEATLQHDREMDERKHQREEDARRRDAEERSRMEDRIAKETAPWVEFARESQTQTIDIMRQIAETKAEAARRETERERELAEEARRQARAAEERPTELKAFGETLTSMLTAIAPKNDGASKEALEAARLEVQRVVEQHQRDSQAREDRHREALDRQRKEHDEDIKRLEDRAKEIERRADERVRDREQRAEDNAKERIRIAEERAKEAEGRAEARVKEAETRADKQIRDVKDELRKAVEEVRAQSQQRLDDERHNHARDLKAQETSAQMRMESVIGQHKMEVTTLTDQLSQARAESERLRGEVDKLGDLPAQVAKFKQSAEMLGMSDSDAGAAPPENFKELLLQLATTLGPQLPDIIGQAGETVRALRGQPAQQQPPGWQGYAQPSGRELPAPLQTADGGAYEAPPSPRMPFGTEDGVDVSDETAPGPAPYASAPTGAPPQARPPQSEQERMFPKAPPPTYPDQPQQRPAPQRAPQQQQPPQQPQGQGGPAIPQVTPQQVLQYKSVLEAALTSGDTPAEIAQQLIAQLQPPMALALTRAVSVERIVSVVQSQPGGSQSPLVRRDGQKFLREVWSEVHKQAGGG